MMRTESQRDKATENEVQRQKRCRAVKRDAFFGQNNRIRVFAYDDRHLRVFTVSKKVSEDAQLHCGQQLCKDRSETTID